MVASAIELPRQDAMRPLHFPPDVRAAIEHDRFHHPVPQIQRRMELLRLVLQRRLP